MNDVATYYEYIPTDETFMECVRGSGLKIFQVKYYTIDEICAMANGTYVNPNQPDPMTALWIIGGSAILIGIILFYPQIKNMFSGVEKQDSRKELLDE